MEWEQLLDGRKKLLLLAIAHEADGSGACSVTQERLAEYCDCSVRQVRRMLTELVAERYLGR
jgi:CRP-like cAMP-binding protein